MRLAWFLALTALITAAPVAARAQSAPTPTADASTSYDHHAVGVRQLVVPLRDGTITDERGQMRHDGTWDAFEGPDHHPIDDEAFFRIVGRDDLLTRYRHKALVRKVVKASGGAALLGGLIFAWVDDIYRNQRNQNLTPGNPSSPPGISPTWGLAVAGAGLTAIIVSHLLNPAPIGPDEADRLARDYDQSLRRSLGLTDTAAR